MSSSCERSLARCSRSPLLPPETSAASVWRVQKICMTAIAVMAGQSSIHSMRGLVAYAMCALLQRAASVTFMRPSTCCSHCSTLPSVACGSMLPLKRTHSPSVDVTPQTRSFSSKLSFRAFSKHLMMCGCTDSGSLVVVISIRSSLDRKKRRGNATRFVSRYSATPLSTASSRRACSANDSTSPSAAVTASTLGSRRTTSI